MTNLEGRVLLRRRALTPPEGVRSDLEVLHGLAERLSPLLGEGRPGADAFPTDPEQVFDELRRASAGGVADYAGISYARIAAERGVFWPCPKETEPGTPRLFTERFATPDGRARFVPVEHRPPAEEPDSAYPLLLVTGRVLAQYQSGAQTRRVAALNSAAPGPYVEVHPRLAARMGIREGQPVRVRSRRGEASAPARLSSGIREDSVFMPFHWPGEGRANTLTNPALDPVSRMPEFKVCAVCIEAADE